MNRPPLEVADLIRVAGQKFIEAIGLSAAGIVPTRSIRAGTDTVPNVRPTLATSGYGRAAADFCPPAD
jgi:hypothetical protein